MPLTVEELGKLAEGADKSGAQVMLEIIPFSNVSTIETDKAIGAARSDRDARESRRPQVRPQ